MDLLGRFAAGAGARWRQHPGAWAGSGHSASATTHKKDFFGFDINLGNRIRKIQGLHAVNTVYSNFAEVLTCFDGCTGVVYIRK